MLNLINDPSFYFTKSTARIKLKAFENLETTTQK